MTENTIATAAEVKKPANVLVGKVVSDKRDKTVTLLVERRVKHPLYGKVVIRSSKYQAHDENNECKVGDIVEIIPTRKLSKTKSWIVSQIVEKAAD
jgi:small subunit ribosomal protein S17